MMIDETIDGEMVTFLINRNRMEIKSALDRVARHYKQRMYANGERRRDTHKSIK